MRKPVFIVLIWHPYFSLFHVVVVMVVPMNRLLVGWRNVEIWYFTSLFVSLRAFRITSFLIHIWNVILHTYIHIFYFDPISSSFFFLLLSFVPLFSPPLPTNNKEFLPPVLASQSVIKFATIRRPYGRISASVCHACSFIHFCFWFRLHLEFDLVCWGR